MDAASSAYIASLTELRVSLPIRPHRVDPRPLKILIHRTGSLGDTLVAIPSLRLVAAAFPNAQRMLLCNEPKSTLATPATAVLEGLGLIEGALTYRSAGAVATARAVWSTVRASAPDVMVSLSAKHDASTALRDWLLFKAAGVPRVIGLGFTQRSLRMRTQAPSYEREAERLARTVRELGTVDFDNAAAWQVQPVASERAGVEQKITGWSWQPAYFCIALGTKMPANDWGQERWLELIELLALDAPLQLVCIGALEDQARSATLLERWPHGGYNLCGRISVRETAAVLAGARLAITHDSGPMHLAAATGTPAIAVFSRRNRMGQWFPLGAGHQVLYSDVDCAECGLEICVTQANLCTRQIAAAAVAERVRATLHAGGRLDMV